MGDRLTEEKHIQAAIVAAREIQEFLWGESNGAWGLEEWRRMFRKRVAKLDEIDVGNPYWRVEMRKRLLQTAALAVAMLALLDDDGVFKGSNLPAFAEPVKGGE